MAEKMADFTLRTRKVLWLGGILQGLKEKKFVIYNLIGPQFCGKPSFSGK